MKYKKRKEKLVYYSKNESSHYAGLNKQPDFLGKINPTYVLSYIYPALELKINPNWV